MEKNTYRSFKSFKEYLNESTKEITVCWVEDMNPASLTHQSLFETTSKVAGKGGMYRIYSPSSKDSILEQKVAVKYARKMFPRHARSIVLDESTSSVHHMLSNLYTEGFTSIRLVVPEDRIPEYSARIEKKNGVSGTHGFYHFREGVDVISSGTKEPSSQRLIESVECNDYQSFVKSLPQNFDSSKALYNDLRKGMGLTEAHDFRTHIQLSPVSEAREAYVSGSLFDIGEKVRMKSGETGTIIMLGSNYVLVEDTEGKKTRHWLDSLERIEESDLALMAPKLDRFLDRVLHNKKYKKGIKYYIQRTSGKGTRQDLVKTARMINVDFNNMEKILHDMINKGLLPKSLATRKDLLEDTLNIDTSIADAIAEEISVLQEEESEVERVRREKEEAKIELEREYQDKIQDAERRDEIDAEQEKRRKERESDNDDEDNTTESVKSFKDYRSKSKSKR